MTQQGIERPTATAIPRSDQVLSARVVGYRLFRMAPDDAPALRRRPGPVPEDWRRVPPSLLRYADDQTVAGTAAVFSAIDGLAMHPSQFHDWGVVAASRYLGRANLAVALRNFMAEGVWGTSPHLIPHFALHSQSGTISLALGSHGPNLGVGGGLHAAADGFLTALTWLGTGVVDGVWLVLSGWSPELVPSLDASSPVTGECRALALALRKTGTAERGPVFRARFGPARAHSSGPLDLAWLEEVIGERNDESARVVCADAQGRLVVEVVSKPGDQG